ncbi:hypothetical protein [uncultured Acinetobacter sp.]|uniref:hypothetical protein n=1 Tax=uncultured Acinetobacter sp. TaxID=165433 RepID=UPI00258E03F6|nr:hypothetical protein [uncultured Acinetobacter sp.]
MILKQSDIDMLLSLFWWQLLVALFLGLFLGSFVYMLFKRAVRAFNLPRIIKTPDGYLHRANNGLYVQKNLLRKTNADYAMKDRKRHISILKRRIEYLESQQ